MEVVVGMRGKVKVSSRRILWRREVEKYVFVVYIRHSIESSINASSYGDCNKKESGGDDGVSGIDDRMRSRLPRVNTAK